MTKKIKHEVESYYSDKIRTYGINPKGVDWNGKESQYIRFSQLSNIIKFDSFSILDYGCGYGEYLNYLKINNYNFQYYGYDISLPMIENAKKLFPAISVSFSNKLDKCKYDYVIASGLFNVRNDISDSDWLSYLLTEIKHLDTLSNSGFAFNALTKYSDESFKKNYLFYADPLYLFDYCKKNFSKNVAILHDYNLYEFTILVRK